jgi:AcrR family transcriptional regulator
MGVEQALVECVAERGIHRVTIDHVARRMGRSRASLYRYYGDWLGVVAFGYGNLLELLDARFPTLDSGRTVVFERWWSLTQQFLGSSTGLAVLALRPFAASNRGLHQLERDEIDRMPAFKSWVKSATVARVLWALALAGCDPTLGEGERGAIREMAANLAVETEAADEIDFSRAPALDAPT